MQKRIIAGIRGLPMEGDIKKLKGTIFYRLRVGSLRIVFEIDHSEKIISIQTIDNRGDIY
jgi:mRNA interferase RelE/StbE